MRPPLKRTFSLSRRSFLAGMTALTVAWNPLAAQDAEIPANLGFLRLVNAVGMSGRLKVKINGMEADPSGFEEGHATSSVGLLPKTYQVDLEHESLGKETIQVAVQTGQIATVMAYKTEKPPKDAKPGGTAKGEAPKKGPRLASLLYESPVSAADVKVPSLTVFQLTATNKIDFKVSGASLAALAERPAQLAVTKAIGNFPEIQLNGKAACLLNFDIPADQVVVFFTGSDGNLKSAQLRNDVR